MTGSGVLTIFVYKGLTRNPEIGDTPVWVLGRGDWGESGIPNLAQMTLIKCYWMLKNTRATAFTMTELLRENQQGIKLPHTQISVKGQSFTIR